MTKESNIQAEIRLALSGAGAVIFRNNVGQTVTQDGRVIRYGVCNPGGADLIGWVPVVVDESMVGQTLAVFCAVEVKRPGGKVSESQQRFLDAVQRSGGIAGVARSPSEALKIIE
jgi:hypothetical protein